MLEAASFFSFPSEHGLTIIVLVRGLGVEEQQTDMSEVMILITQYSFAGFGQSNLK